MSQSRRHTPIFGITTARSEKRDKRLANRCLRRCVKTLLAVGRDDLPLLREVSDVRSFDKDGKAYNHHWLEEDMRK